MFIIGVLVALGVLVIVHELGHFLAARSFGVVVDKFSIGFGPKLFGFKKGATTFLVSLIPLGGYVKMSGDEPSKEAQYNINDFYGQEWWKRALIVFAGPIANLILGFILFASSFMVGRVIEDQYPIIGQLNEEWHKYFQVEDRIVSINGKEVNAWTQLIRYTNSNDTDVIILKRDGEEYMIKTDEIEPNYWMHDILPLVPATIGTVAPGMPAYRSGLKEGDTIVKVDNKEIDNWYEMRKKIMDSPDDEVELLINREGSLINTVVPLETNLIDSSGQKIIGITQQMKVQYFENYNVLDSVKYGFYSSVNFIMLNYHALFRIITRPFLAKDNIGGPVMIITMSRQTAQLGWGAILAFVASISLILMIMNLLPIPVLDGGHILFSIIEGIGKKPLAYKTQLIIQQIGFMILIILMLFAFYNDIARIVRRNISLRLQQSEIIDQ